MAVNPWVGYEADAYVVGRVAETQLGCQVNYKNLNEQVSWAGFGTGEVDVVMENWGHDELAAKYITDRRRRRFGDRLRPDRQRGHHRLVRATVARQGAPGHHRTGRTSTSTRRTSRHRSRATRDSSSTATRASSRTTRRWSTTCDLNLQGRLRGQRDRAHHRRSARRRQNQSGCIGYFYEPQWFLSEVPLVKVDLPKYTPGCDADAEKVACDYPVYHLNKVVSTDWANSGAPDVDLGEELHLDERRPEHRGEVHR